jgi:hypothetical protein
VAVPTGCSADENRELGAMSFRSINPERLSFLLSQGTEEGELRRFFKECQKQLILKGAKIQNLPHGRAARIAAIVGKLPTPTDAIVSEWFHRNITMVDPLPASEVIEEFELYEVANDVLPPDHATRLARSCITHLFTPDPSINLLTFLKTRIGASPIPESKEPEDSTPFEVPSTEETEPLAAHGQDVLLELLAVLTEGGDAGDLLDQLPGDLAAYAAALIDARRGDVDAAEIALQSMAAGSKEHQLLSRSIKRAAARDEQAKIARGVELVGVDEGAEDFDAQSEAILAYCKTDRPTATFVQPIAVLRNSRALFFSSVQREEAFPETGDVIAFSGSAYPKQPKRGEIGFWRVVEHRTDQKTRFHLDAEVASVYEITKVPFLGADTDSVREFIKHTWDVRKSASLQLQLYELADGMVIAPRNDRADLSRDDGYEQPFNSWNHISAVPFEGRAVVVGPLPAATGAYECAPLAYVAKQLTKAAIDQGTVQLKNTQKKELSALFTSLDVGVNKQRVRRVTAELDRAIADEVALQEIVSLLLSHPEVSKRIDEGVEEIVHSRAAEKDLQLGEIERLKKEKAAWEGKLKETIEKSRRQASDAVSTVKAAFDKAINAGTETLVNAAIVKALNGEQDAKGQSRGVSHPGGNNLLVAQIGALTRQEAIGRLAASGVDRRFATGILGAVDIASQCGLVVCLRGTFARHVTRVIASGIGETAVAISIGIGLVESEQLWHAVCKNKNADVVALLDANLSAIDLYGRTFIDQMFSRVCDQTQIEGPAFLLSLNDGAMSLAIPDAIRRLSITIDLDGRPDLSSTADSNKLESLLARSEGAMSFPLELAMERVREQLDELDPTVRDLVSMVFAAALEHQ